MTISGQLSVTASDDARFKAGDSIGIVIDSDCTVTVTQNVEVSAPTVAPPAITTPGGSATDAPTDVRGAVIDNSDPTTATADAVDTGLAAGEVPAPGSVPPATA